MISFFSKDVKFTLKNKSFYKKWLTHLIVNRGFKLESVNVIFCNDNYILEINNQFLKHNYYTDIITFDYCNGNKISGELYISIDTVKANTVEYNQTFENELNRVIAHGFLHLCGLDDHSQEDILEMRKAEDEALNILPSFFNPDKL